MKSTLYCWKGKILSANAEIKDLTERLEREKARATSTVGRLSFEGHSPTPVDKVADGTVRIIALQEEIARRIGERDDMERGISAIGNPTARRAIRLYAESRLPWWRIAEMMNYSESGIKKICAHALESVTESAENV